MKKIARYDDFRHNMIGDYDERENDRFPFAGAHSSRRESIFLISARKRHLLESRCLFARDRILLMRDIFFLKKMIKASAFPLLFPYEYGIIILYNFIYVSTV